MKYQILLVFALCILWKIPAHSSGADDSIPLCKGTTPRQLCGTARSSEPYNSVVPCKGEPGHPHPNGGGFVANTASVSKDAYVGPNATVCELARVLHSAKIDGHARVFGQAAISGDAHLAGNAWVWGRANVAGNAVVLDNARVFGRATLIGFARVYKNGCVGGDRHLMDSNDVETTNADCIGYRIREFNPHALSNGPTVQHEVLPKSVNDGSRDAAPIEIRNEPHQSEEERRSVAR